MSIHLSVCDIEWLKCTYIFVAMTSSQGDRSNVDERIIECIFGGAPHIEIDRRRHRRSASSYLVEIESNYSNEIGC